MKKAPSKSRIQNWVDHFEKYGTVENVNVASENRPNRAGRKCERVSPGESETLFCKFLGMSSETCKRVLVNNIRAYPYRIKTLSTLKDSDKKQKSAMTVKMLKKIEKTPGFLNLL